MVSNDPDFETNAADVIGLYLNLKPPARAAVFCVDEKTAIRPWIVRFLQQHRHTPGHVRFCGC